MVGIRRFTLVDEYVGRRMGLDLAALPPGRPRVVATPLRLRREQSYGYVRALWLSWFADGRSAVSVPPGAAATVERVIASVSDPEGAFSSSLADALRQEVDPVLIAHGRKPTDRVIHDVHLACDASLLRRYRDGACGRVTDQGVPPADGLGFPTHCLPDGVVYGVTADGALAAVAYSHKTGVMEDTVADLAVTTAPAYRRRGFGRTVVSAVVAHFTAAGGEALYGCSPDNRASIATARTVGFVPYARTLILSAPAEA